MRNLAGVSLLLMLPAVCMSFAAERQVIGTVFGKPVHRDELAVSEESNLEEELRRLFLAPVMQKYLEKHQAEVEPTPQERKLVADNVAARHRYFMEKEGPGKRARLKEVRRLLAQKGDLGMNAQMGIPEREALRMEKGGLEADLEPLDPKMEHMLLGPWKLQKHLYDTFGGGRILWQQFGLEAFDATRKMLENEEAQGHFRVTDPELRKVLFAYWTTKNHGQFLVSDPKRIQDEFVNPSFMRPFDPNAVEEAGEQ